MRACIEVQFCDVDYYSKVVKPPARTKPASAKASANSGSSSKAATAQPKIADAVNPETKIAAHVGMQVKPLRVLSGHPPAPPVASASSLASAGTGEAIDAHEGEEFGNDDIDDGEDTQSEYDPNEGKSSKKLAKKPAKQERQWFWSFKEGSQVFSARFVYRPQSILVEKGVMPDPDNPAANAQGKASPKKRKLSKAPNRAKEAASRGAEAASRGRDCSNGSRAERWTKQRSGSGQDRKGTRRPGDHQLARPQR